MKKKVAIIGAGIAGLTFANLLKTNPNFEFVIYEKAEAFNLTKVLVFNCQLTEFQF